MRSYAGRSRLRCTAPARAGRARSSGRDRATARSPASDAAPVSPATTPMPARSRIACSAVVVVDRDEHVDAARHRGPRDDRHRAAVEPGHDRVVRAGHHDRMAGLGRVQPARGASAARPRRSAPAPRSARPPPRRARRRPSAPRRRRAARAELFVDLGEDRAVALDHGARHLGVALPRRVRHDEHVVGGERGRRAHRVVVGAVDDGDRRAFARDPVDARPAPCPPARRSATRSRAGGPCARPRGRGCRRSRPRA